jgi:hypothetical protein
MSNAIRARNADDIDLTIDLVRSRKKQGPHVRALSQINSRP